MFCGHIKNSMFFKNSIFQNSFNNFPKLLKGNFSSNNIKINPRTFKKLNIVKDKDIRKFRNRYLKNENTGSKENGNSLPKDNKIPDFNPWKLPLIAGSLVIIGVIKSIKDILNMKKNPMVTYEEFESEYLLHGEVQTVIKLGHLSQILSGCTADVILYPDNDRNYQTIGIKNFPKDHVIFRRIKNKEDELNVKRNEKINLTFSLSDLLIYAGFTVYAYSILRRKSNAISFTQQFNSKPNYSQSEKKVINEQMLAREKRIKQEKPPDLFSSFIVDTSTEQFEKRSDIKFKDVAGLHSAKQEVREFLDYLNNPSKFIKLGARLPRGAMLLGPPGCGKTLLVKALANESNVPFYYKAGSEFVDMIGGVGAKRMRELFLSARNNAPAIIFIDEIDAIGKKRSGSGEGIGDADQTLNQLLVEMDGMDSNAGIVVFAATNRAEVLDTALIRPGRLDRHILIDFPVLEERRELFDLYLNKYADKLDSSVYRLKDKLALQTPGMSGADISNLCNEAALTAAKLDYTTIKNECFDIALERIIAGAAKKNHFMSEAERKIVAYHEAGHTLVGWILKYADPIIKVSIVPRTNAALGFTQLNVGERYLLNSDILTDRIAVLLGGRAAESIIFNRVTSGAHDDLKKVKKLAFSMIREWGMSEKIGHLSFKVTEEDDEIGNMPYSKGTQYLIECEANSIVTKAYQRAEALLRDNISKLELIAEELLKKEMLVYNDIELLIGPRPHGNLNMDNK